jgi:hypothetical protein
MKRGYIIYRKLKTGEMLRIASRNTLREARALAKSLDRHWPGKYLVQKSSDETAEKKPSHLRGGDRMHATYAGAGFAER